MSTRAEKESHRDGARLPGPGVQTVSSLAGCEGFVLRLKASRVSLATTSSSFGASLSAFHAALLKFSSTCVSRPNCMLIVFVWLEVISIHASAARPGRTFLFKHGSWGQSEHRPSTLVGCQLAHPFSPSAGLTGVASVS